MRASLAIVAGILASAMPAIAQSTVHPQAGFGVMGGTGDAKPAASLTVVPDASAACPVAMRAERRAGLGVLQARNARNNEPQVAGQRIYLEIERGEHAAVEAKVTVHGTRAQARVFPAQVSPVQAAPVQASPTLSSPAAKGTADAVKSFTLRPGSREAERIAYNLQLEGFTSVQSISLDAVTYEDGSIWRAGAGRSCSVEPDPLMLISSR